uniref:CDS_Hyp_gene-3 n=1 Tax=Aegilops tauschii TaxID=37682 RepID=Q5BHU5_AEGTA|nr:Hypothetical protein [Aegilops tauschii]CAJ13971.1 unnamed protein product [Aegilops tauschii]
MEFFSNKGKGKCTFDAGDGSSRAPPPDAFTMAPPVARRQPLPHRIPVPTEPWSPLAHAEEVRKRSALLMQEQRPPVLAPEEEAAEATYQAALEEALQRALEESQRKEGARWPGVEEALQMSVPGDCVYPPHRRRCLNQRRPPQGGTHGGPAEEWTQPPPDYVDLTGGDDDDDA